MSDPASHDDTRDAYDRTADVYVEWIGSELRTGIEAPADLELVDAFVDGLRSDARVVDLGCGPGRMAAHLRRCGHDAIGVDLSFGMLREASRLHPDLPVCQGDLSALPLCDTAFDGAVLWYSIVHAPLAHLPAFFAEVRRVLVDGAPVLLGFQAGDDEALHRDQIAGRPVSLSRMRHAPASVTAALAAAGFEITSTVVRDPIGTHEDSPQAFVAARARPLS